MSTPPGEPDDQEHPTQPYGVPPGSVPQPGPAGPGSPPGPGHASGPGYPAPPGYGYPTAQPQGYGPGYPPGYASGYIPGYVQVPALPEHPSATKALVLGIVALAGGLTCYLPILAGPWAWVAGRRAVREIDADPGRWGGRSQAMAGYVMGVIATVVLALGVLAIAVVIAIVVIAAVNAPDPQPIPGGTTF